MGIFGTKEKNYDNEIALINQKQNELAKITDKNKSDVVALGLDFSEYKETIGNQLNEVWNFMKDINSDLAEFKKWKEEQHQEAKSIRKAKEELPDTLTYKEVCQSLNGFNYLDVTSFKYYLYDNGILDLKINPIRNTYRISSDYDNSTSELKQYIHITDGVITFDKGILDYLVKNSEEIQNSINKYYRKQNQFKESKQHLSTLEVKNYQDEIGNICGVDRNGKKYDASKWAAIYKRYEAEHNNWLNKYYKWVDQFLKDNPNYQYDKPSRVQYLVQEVGDGDVLLKIACELFVD